MCSVNCNGQWTLGSLYLGQHLVPCISVGHHYGQEVARRVHFKVLASPGNAFSSYSLGGSSMTTACAVMIMLIRRCSGMI